MDRAATQPDVTWTELQLNLRRLCGQSCDTTKDGLVNRTAISSKCGLVVRAATQPRAAWWTGLQYSQRSFGGEDNSASKGAGWTGLQYGLRWLGGQSCKTIKGGLMDRAAIRSKAAWWSCKAINGGLMDRAAICSKAAWWTELQNN